MPDIEGSWTFEIEHSILDIFRKPVLSNKCATFKTKY